MLPSPPRRVFPTHHPALQHLHLFLNPFLVALHLTCNLPLTLMSTSSASLLNLQPPNIDAYINTSYPSSSSTPLTPRQHALVNTYLTSLRPSLHSYPPSQLLTTGVPRSFTTGTGLDITTHISAHLLTARHEILFATCFWAPSSSLTHLASTLRTLSAHRLAHPELPPLRVRICMSSLSLLQKLLPPATQSYPPSTWQRTLHLPAPEELAGLDLTVTSKFYLPFSVLHSKYVIVDRETLLLPSSNISWEPWLEQCSVFTGGIVRSFLWFYDGIWGLPAGSVPVAARIEGVAVPLLFLPQPHARNPRFLSHAPVTPQNCFISALLGSAQRSVYLQTPNLTTAPIVRGLKEAVRRGVVVTVVTVKRMMVLEQLVTALGVATECVVRRLVKWERRRGRDLEAGGGRLNVFYYEEREGEEPVKTHVKALVVDGEVAVMGSANADRASWFTSQEVNVGVLDAEFAGEVEKRLRGEVRGKGRWACGGGEL